MLAVAMLKRRLGKPDRYLVAAGAEKALGIRDKLRANPPKQKGETWDMQHPIAAQHVPLTRRVYPFCGAAMR